MYFTNDNILQRGVIDTEAWEMIKLPTKTNSQRAEEILFLLQSRKQGFIILMDFLQRNNDHMFPSLSNCLDSITEEEIKGDILLNICLIHCISIPSSLCIYTGELGYDTPLYDTFLHSTDDMLGPSIRHMYTMDFAYDEPIILVLLSPSYPSSPVYICMHVP